jgi:tetratricopeptide (TPR) repeat protein
VSRRLFFFLLISFPALSQYDPGDLKKSLAYYQKQNNPDSISYYYRLLAYQYLTDQSYDSARYYLKYGLEYSVNDPAAFALCLHYMGVLNYHTGDLDSSIHYYNAAYEQYEKTQDTASLVALETNLGIIYKVKGLYQKSVEYLLRASRKLV